MVYCTRYVPGVRITRTAVLSPSSQRRVAGDGSRVTVTLSAALHSTVFVALSFVSDAPQPTFTRKPSRPPPSVRCRIGPGAVVPGMIVLVVLPQM